MKNAPTRQQIMSEWYPERPSPVTCYIEHLLAGASQPMPLDAVVCRCVEHYGVSSETVGRYLRMMRSTGTIEFVRRLGDQTRYVRLRGGEPAGRVCDGGYARKDGSATRSRRSGPRGRRA